MPQLDFDLQSIQEMRDVVQKAKEAQSQYLKFSQQEVDKVVKKVAEAAFAKAEELAELAVNETGMGIVGHKKMKNELGSMGVYESIRNERSVGVIKEDPDSKVMEIAEPFGIIAGIIPTTNPTSTAIFKTLVSLKTRNAIVVSPHPNAVKSTIAALEICRNAAISAGVPEGIIGWISKPTMTTIEELMRHKDINLILATGGSGLVKAAYGSGKPAYGVGPGNVPVYIEKTANVREAVKMVVDSKTFDNGTLCSSEQAIVVDSDIKQAVIEELKNNGAYFLDDNEKRLVENVIATATGGINASIVGRSALAIANIAGISVPTETRVLISEESKVGKEAPFSMEKLSPILALYTVSDTYAAKERCLQVLNFGGKGHTAALHTNNEDIAEEFAIEMPVSRFLVNTLSSIGAAGATTNLAPTLTLGCGSYGGNITSDNITARHLVNIKRMAYGVRDAELPSSDKLQQGMLSERITESVGNALHSAGSIGKIDEHVIAEVVEQVIKQFQRN